MPDKDDDLGSEDEIRRRAQDLLGTDFQFSPPDEGIEVMMYDWYLKLKRAGFREKQTLWMLIDIIFGGHGDPELGHTEDGNSSGDTSS